MSKRLYPFLFSLGALVVAGVLILLNAPVSTAAAPPFEVIASGLDNPRGIAFGPKGALYVAEAGRGRGNDTGAPCVPGELGEDVCFGPTGAVTRVWHGKQKRIVTGLSSFANISDNGFAFGPHDISFKGWHGAYVVVGACFDPVGVDDGCGQLIRLQKSGGWQSVADLTAYEVDNNPDDSHVESDPYAVLALTGHDDDKARNRSDP